MRSLCPWWKDKPSSKWEDTEELLTGVKCGLEISMKHDKGTMVGQSTRGATHHPPELTRKPNKWVCDQLYKYWEGNDTPWKDWLVTCGPLGLSQDFSGYMKRWFSCEFILFFLHCVGFCSVIRWKYWWANLIIPVPAAIHLYMHACAYTQMHVYTHIAIYTRVHTNMLHTCAGMYTHKPVYTYACNHVYTCAHTCMYTHNRQAGAYTHTCIHVGVYTHKRYTHRDGQFDVRMAEWLKSLPLKTYSEDILYCEIGRIPKGFLLCQVFVCLKKSSQAVVWLVNGLSWSFKLEYGFI